MKRAPGKVVEAVAMEMGSNNEVADMNRDVREQSYSDLLTSDFCLKEHKP